MGNKLTNLYENYESICIKSTENILKGHKSSFFKDYALLSENCFYQHQIGQAHILKTMLEFENKENNIFYLEKGGMGAI